MMTARNRRSGFVLEFYFSDIAPTKNQTLSQYLDSFISFKSLLIFGTSPNLSDSTQACHSQTPYLSISNSSHPSAVTQANAPFTPSTLPTSARSARSSLSPFASHASPSATYRRMTTNPAAPSAKITIKAPTPPSQPTPRTTQYRIPIPQNNPSKPPAGTSSATAALAHGSRETPARCAERPFSRTFSTGTAVCRSGSPTPSC